MVIWTSSPNYTLVEDKIKHEIKVEHTPLKLLFVKDSTGNKLKAKALSMIDN